MDERNPLDPENLGFFFIESAARTSVLYFRRH